MTAPPAAPVPPQNLEAEESVLGAMLISQSAIDACTDLLHAADFYRDSHARIYRAILDLYGRGQAVDAITLTDELEKRGDLDQAGGKQRIHEIASLVTATSNASHYARIVRDMAQLRALIRVGQECQRLGYERPGDTENLIDQAQQLAYDLSPHAARGGTEQIGGATVAAFERMSTLAERGADIIGTPSGFRDLDRLTTGFEPGNLIILAARPSMGKSALAHAIVANVGIRQNLPVAIFTFEMSKQEIAQRLLAREAKVDLGKIRAPGRHTSPDDWSRIAKAADQLQKAPIYVNETSTTLVQLRRDLRRLKSRQPDLGLVVVDYLGLMHVPGLKADNQTIKITLISNGLKQLARDFQVPLLAVSQLSRAVEQRVDKRPQLSDLRDSGSLEQDADLAMFLYRDDYYNPDTDRPGITEINVAKHRNGPTGTVDLYFVKPYATFTELAR